jgi:hypothetical protein
VRRAEEWAWSSLQVRLRGRHRSSRSGLVPPDWCALVNLVQDFEVLDRLRREIARRPGRPTRTPTATAA